MAEISSIDGIAEGNIDKVDSLVKANISNINGYSFPELFNELFNFEDQTTQESGGADWNPSGTHSGWETDTAVVTGGGSWGNPAGNSNITTDGWNLGFGGTGSSGTGPNGGVHSDLDGSHDTSGRYMYVEGTGLKDDRVCVVRSPGFNFSTSMLSTSNDLDLKFWLHQYSSTNSGHDLFIYIDDASTSTESDATLLTTIDDFSEYNSNGANWSQKTVSLNSYRTTDSTFYIYFVADGATNFRCDIAIDNVQFLES
jgi:hypothetical protein